MHRIDLEITDAGDTEEEGEPDSSIEPEERQMKVVDPKKKKVQETREVTVDVVEEEVDITEETDISEVATEEVCSGVGHQRQ